jgi:hypothetical protein
MKDDQDIIMWGERDKDGKRTGKTVAIVKDGDLLHIGTCNPEVASVRKVPYFGRAEKDDKGQQRFFHTVRSRKAVSKPWRNHISIQRAFFARDVHLKVKRDRMSKHCMTVSVHGIKEAFPTFPDRLIKMIIEGKKYSDKSTITVPVGANTQVKMNEMCAGDGEPCAEGHDKPIYDGASLR